MFMHIFLADIKVDNNNTYRRNYYQQ